MMVIWSVFIFINMVIRFGMLESRVVIIFLLLLFFYSMVWCYFLKHFWDVFDVFYVIKAFNWIDLIEQCFFFSFHVFMFFKFNLFWIIYFILGLFSSWTKDFLFGSWLNQWFRVNPVWFSTFLIKERNFLLKGMFDKHVFWLVLIVLSEIKNEFLPNKALYIWPRILKIIWAFFLKI
jgi:hypothetical protein